MGKDLTETSSSSSSSSISSSLGDHLLELDMVATVVVFVVRRRFVVCERAGGRRVQGCLTRLRALAWSRHVSCEERDKP
jgi:hypothetical protein